MTELISQRSLTDCMVCSIAMALALSYEVVFEAAVKSGAYKPESGKGIRDQDDILELLGLTRSASYKGIPGDFTDMHCPFGIAPEFLRFTLWGRPTILSVESLNIEGGYHAVYYDGYQLFDPSPLKRYEKIEDCKPRNAIVFRSDYRDTLKAKRADLDVRMAS